jgi:hypothetical protein
MINRMTGEPILPARTANQYLAYWFAVRAGKIGSPVMLAYWFAVRAGKIGSPVMRFIKPKPRDVVHDVCVCLCVNVCSEVLGLSAPENPVVPFLALWLSHLQDLTIGGSPAPLLTREGGPESRGTKHFRLLIPKGIAGISENERATLQAWLELVDWTGLGVLPNSQVPRNLKLTLIQLVSYTTG